MWYWATVGEPISLSIPLHIGYNMLESLYQDAHLFLQKLFAEADTKNLNLQPHWDIDHICYRTESLDRYAELKRGFEKEHALLIESEVNGRPISTFRLSTPIQFKQYKIHLLELPAPKPDKLTQRGFEHIEVVCDQTFDDLKNQFKNFRLKSSGLEKVFNQELEIIFESGSIKFHQLSLASVVQLEKNKPVMGALMDSQVLVLFKKHSPLVAGTFPLGLSVANSDLDIILQATNLKQFKKDILSNYGHLSKFKIDESIVEGMPSLVAQFEWEGVPFELFAQDRPSVQQRSYQHFLIEEKLLKYCGSDFREKVIANRRRGMKTEPAFAEALSIEGDSYTELLSLQLLPLQELQARHVKN